MGLTQIHGWSAFAGHSDVVIEQPRGPHNIGARGGSLTVHHVETAADRQRQATIVARELGPMGINQRRRAGVLNRVPRRSVRKWRAKMDLRQSSHDVYDYFSGRPIDVAAEMRAAQLSRDLITTADNASKGIRKLADAWGDYRSAAAEMRANHEQREIYAEYLREQGE